MLIDEVRKCAEQRYPYALKTIEQTRATAPERFDSISERFLGWAKQGLGDDWLNVVLRSYIEFTVTVNRSQIEYERTGSYAETSYQDCDSSLYSQTAPMTSYLWGVYLSNFIWPHHFELSQFYQDRFLPRVPPQARILEIAPGHGGWGVWALDTVSDAMLRGYDISPASIQIARSVADAAGVGERATYVQQDALSLKPTEDGALDIGICNFLLEHLEDPSQVITVLADNIKPGGLAFISGALTAAQIDHVYEFLRESELLELCERGGFRVLESLSADPGRQLPGAKHMPRSMAMIAVRRKAEHW